MRPVTVGVRVRQRVGVRACVRARVRACACGVVVIATDTTFLTLYMFIHLTAMRVCTFGVRGLGRAVVYFIGMNVFGGFSLLEPIMHAVCIWRCEHARF